jgi:hypothetical protein
MDVLVMSLEHVFESEALPAPLDGADEGSGPRVQSRHVSHKV